MQISTANDLNKQFHTACALRVLTMLKVVYFESSEDLEMTDVGISDAMLAITHRVS